MSAPPPLAATREALAALATEIFGRPWTPGAPAPPPATLRVRVEEFLARGAAKPPRARRCPLTVPGPARVEPARYKEIRLARESLIAACLSPRAAWTEEEDLASWLRDQVRITLTLQIARTPEEHRLFVPATSWDHARLDFYAWLRLRIVRRGGGPRFLTKLAAWLEARYPARLIEYKASQFFPEVPILPGDHDRVAFCIFRRVSGGIKPPKRT